MFQTLTCVLLVYGVVISMMAIVLGAYGFSHAIERIRSTNEPIWFAVVFVIGVVCLISMGTKLNLVYYVK